MSTVRDLVQGSLRLLGVKASGEALTADEMADGLSVANDLLDSWSNENLIIYSKIREVFTLVPGQAAYTMGTGGNFNTSRPMNVDLAYIQLAGTTPPLELPVKILNLDEWAGISVKDLGSSIPTKIFPDYTNPMATINVWPVPDGACSLVLYSWKALTQFASANTDVIFPPGYKRALRYNLAVELAPEYGVQASAEIVNIAIESKESVKRMNIKPAYLVCDESVRSRSRTFNWLTGE